MENRNGGERTFVLNVLPWIVAAVALLVYAATLNHWVSLFNITYVGKLSGWTWEPEFYAPLYLLATYPLRGLPTEWIPLGLNLFSTACAVVTIGQLARSVALLPHDRTHEQRLREHGDHSLLSGPLSWLPPALAAATCGLQLTFWEHGTNGSYEMFSLLVFSYVVRSLLEYRLDGSDARLYRTVFIFAAGMANDWAMLGFFPAFVVAIIWFRGMSFFNFRFLTRTLLFGLAGLSFYLLLPSLVSHSNVQPVSFWLALKANFIAQKNLLLFFPRKTFVLFCLASLLPVFLLSIRWASYFGDSSRIGTLTATWIFHLVHAVFLLVCVWSAFDPPFSPRHRVLELPSAFTGISFLSLYYLGALSVGYYSGYFLVVFRAAYSRGRQIVPVLSAANQLGHIFVISLAVFVPAGLVWKNLPQIQITNGPMLKDFAAAQAADLPHGGAILSDDASRLFLLRSWLTRIQKDRDFIFVDTHDLVWPGYHRYLMKCYPAKWKESTDPKRERMFSPTEITRPLWNLARTEELWYLQPSFGYYFEFFYLRPHGLSYQLKMYGTKIVLPPRLDSELVDSNERFWANIIQDELPPVLSALKSDSLGGTSTSRRKILAACHLPLDPNITASYIAACFSRALDYWGTRVQALGMLDRAGIYFDLALQTKPDNVVAQINLECNQKLRAGQSPAVEMSRSYEDLFDRYRSWDQILNANGPYDEPNFCYAEGYTFLKDGLYRQAAQEFDRVSELSPGDLTSRLLLAQINLLARVPDKVLSITTDIRNHAERFALSGTNEMELACLEAAAHFQLKQTNAGVALLEDASYSDASSPEALGHIAVIYWQSGLYTRALNMLDRQLKLAPDDVTTLINKSYVYSLMKDYDNSILVLDEALKVDPDNASALLDRAIGNLEKGQLDKSWEDYSHLQKLFPNAHQAYYGLAEIAYRRRDTNTAILNYKAYLTNAPSGTAESVLVTNRINELIGVRKS